MMHAAREGHVNVIEALLEAGADVDYTRQRPTVSFLPSRAEGWTALMSAAQGGRLEAAKRLLRARADLWAVNVDDSSPKWDGFTAVAVAVHGGHRGLVQLLVEKFANVNPPPGKEHAAPLLLACEHGDRPIVDMLLAAGARRWMQDAAGNTPLIVAARNGHTAVVRALLTSAEASPSPRFAGMMARLLDMLHLPQSLGSAAREGEDLDLIQAVNERDSQGWPALLHAAANGHHAVLALLVEARADVNAGRDWSALSRLTTASGAGQTALHVCCRQGMVDSVVLLLAAKAAPDARDEDQQTPLMHAAHRAGNGAILTALLQVRADVDARDDTGCSAILYAAARGKVDAVAVLVEAKANVNLADKKDRSALMAAAEAGHADAARLLVAARANASAADSNAQTALTLAVRRRHLPVVRALLDAGASESALPAPRWIEAFAHPNPAQAVAALVHSGADVNVADAEGRTPLQLACECHAPNAIQALLGAHADGTAALLRAAADSHAATARQLLEGRVDVDGRNADGQTALMVACLGAHHTALEVLLQHRADIHLSDHGRRTALLIAARDANVQALQLLVHARAAVNAVDMRGRTPLMLAADSEHACGAAAEVLLGAKADVNVAGQGGKTALIFAAGRGHCDVTLALLRAAADVNSATAQGLTALIYAAGNGHAAAAALLLAARADAGRPDHARRTALMYAAKAGSAPAVQALLAAPAGRFSSSPEDAKALAQATDRDGLTALHHACKRGHPHVAELLIAAGADHLASTANGLTALALACKEGHAPVAQLLLRASSAPLEEAPPGGGDGALQPQEGSPRQCLECSDPLSDAWDGAVTYFADLFRLDHPPMPGAVAGLKGRFVANVNSADAQGWTALHHAASMGYLELLRALLAADADVHAVTDAGDTPLTRAAVQGHGEAARLLLRARADVNARNKAGATVLIAVCHCSREGADVAQLLLDAGAHVNVADQLGTTALMSAAQHNHCRVLRLLLKKDALVDVRDHDQKTALFYASAMGYTEVLEMLLDTKADPQLATVDGHTPLTAAVSGGHAVEVARLLAAKADPNAITDDGWTALGITAYNANLGIAEVLLAHRADLELHLTDAGDPGDPVWPPSEDPRTAATPKGRSVPCATPSSVLSPQLEYSQRSLLTPMSPETVIGLRSPKVQSVPWAFRPDLQPRSMTPLMIACRAGHLDVVEFLLARQAQVDALGGSRSALMHAAAAGHLGVLAALLRAGAAVNAADAHGATALACAVLSSSEEAVGCLLEAQADVHAVCTLPTLGPGLPIVAVAAAQGSVPILELLLEADADPSATAADGRTALAIAAQSGHTDLVKRLWRRRRQASVANLSLSQEPDSNSQSGRPSSFPLPLCPTSQTSD